ncbi:class I adenylate-forming enzyme family protein [Sulfurovum sp. NBC37-1]|uniref:class I adenylate-forming enzyme family protein n=1 Tax=Sulfurovum sp. (strain NBC37-1) TaxID=387093 RepID=UPI00015875B4|nr:class I adenylate-forming enzyme family protein [Sulfurovum sp. NBC37-1]BAF71833.1 long-chain fatty-acid-CoA ligase [Sulfurovum sp. NBC37-1]
MLLLYEIIDQAVKQTPDKKAVICGEKSYTYAQLSEKMDLWAKTLISLGITRGDRVALFMKNSVELVGLYFACFRIGAIAVPLNTRYQTPEAVYGIEQSGSRILITSSELFPVVENLDSTVASLEHIYIMDGDSNHASLSWNKMLTDTANNRVIFPDLSITDPALIIYTSGSTGEPKGVVHTHETLYHLIEYRSAYHDTIPSDSVLIATQICHMAGFTMALFFLKNSATVVMVEEFEPGAYIKLLNQYKPILTGLLPTQFLEVLECPGAEQADFSPVKYALSAGDKVSHHLYELFRILAGHDIMEAYGLTEAEGCFMQPKEGKIKPGTIGKPIWGTQARLIDKDGRDVPRGKTGEIFLKGKLITIGYWNKPEENKKAFENGWFHTGDLAYEDEEGYYHFVGRIKELIIRGGSNIMPGEVEDVLEDHPKVESCGIVGFPDKHYGSIVGAFVVPRQGVPAPTADELRDFVSQRLSHYKVPQKWIFVDSLPKNPVGKIDRKKLHSMAEQYIASGF